MWNVPSKKQLAKIPKLYENDNNNVLLGDTLIYLHFFIGGCDWYIAEYDGDDTFFGYANLNDDINAEWGHVSFSELKELKIKGFMEVDCDLHWKPKPAQEVAKIILH